MAHDDDRGEARPATINLSRDLVRLGIAPRNLPANDPSFDARPVFEAAVRFVSEHHTERLIVDRGVYYFLTPQDSLAYLRLRALSNLTVDLSGSKIVFAGAFLQGFALVGCDHVTLRNFEIDFLHLPFTEVELVSVDPARRRLVYRTLPNWPDPVSFTTPGEEAPVPVQLWAVAFRGGDIVPGTSRMPVVQPITAGALDLIQDNAPWTQGPTLATLELGDTVVVSARGGQEPVLVFGGNAITIAHGIVRASGQIAVFLDRVSESTVEDVRVIPRPGALISANADGIHFGDAASDNHVRHNFVTRTLDDALAIDGLAVALVQQQRSPRQLVVKRQNVERFVDGTAVNFVDPATAAEIAGGTIVAQVPADTLPPVGNGTVTLTFDRDLPRLAAGAGVVLGTPETRGNGSSIEENVVEDILFGRGVWVGGTIGVEVKRNRIGRTSSGGISVSQNTTFFPGPPAHDITIEDNVLRGSLGPMASGVGSQIAVGAILVESQDATGGFSHAAVNTNVIIRGNRIDRSGRSGIWVGELDGGEIRDNVITHWDSHPELPVFGVDAATRVQLLRDFTRPLVVR